MQQVWQNTIDKTKKRQNSPGCNDNWSQSDQSLNEKIDKLDWPEWLHGNVFRQRYASKNA